MLPIANVARWHGTVPRIGRLVKGVVGARYLNTRAGGDTGRSAFGIHLMFASQPVDRTGAFANILSAAVPIRYSLNIHKYVAL